MISPGCSFSSGNIRINATAVEVFTGVTKIWSNIMVLFKENKKKKSVFSWVWSGNQREELTGFLWGKKALTGFLWGKKAETRVSAALILKTGFACSCSGGVVISFVNQTLNN